MQATVDSLSSGRKYPLALLCVLLSALLHAGGAWLLLQTSHSPQKERTANSESWKSLKINLRKKQNASSAIPQEDTKKTQLPFAKTDSDRVEQVPEKADFRGKRNTRAEGETDGPRRQSDAPVPTMAGEERKEINTLERDFQDGPIEHDGKPHPQPLPPPTPEPVPGQPALHPVSEPHIGKDNETTQSPQATPTARPLPETKKGSTQLQPSKEQQTSPLQAQQARPTPGTPEEKGKSRLRTPPQVRRPVYDPSLADHAQPGFRTRERRTRSTGRFILGRNPSLSVSATPLGRYEELVYRLIARRWYAACDDHRGDIIPGRIIISIRLNKSGSVDNMNLITRRGASVIQQSFTFGAIRRAQLPPMPPAVQQELIGEQLELIFTFHFD